MVGDDSVDCHDYSDLLINNNASGKLIVITVRCEGSMSWHFNGPLFVVANIMLCITNEKYQGIN